MEALNPPENAITEVTNIKPPNISQAVIWSESIRFTNKPFETVNKVAKKEDIRAKVIPSATFPFEESSPSAELINTIPPIIAKERRISYNLIFRLKKIGSIKDIKNVLELIAIIAIETEETLIASKKVSQCAPTINPIPIITIKSLGDFGRIFFRIKNPTRIKDTKAIPILNQTISSEDFVINFPRIAVKPQINTMKCRII
jgi:hypothetical protein